MRKNEENLPAALGFVSLGRRPLGSYRCVVGVLSARLVVSSASSRLVSLCGHICPSHRSSSPYLVYLCLARSLLSFCISISLSLSFSLSLSLSLSYHDRKIGRLGFSIVKHVSPVCGCEVECIIAARQVSLRHIGVRFEVCSCANAGLVSQSPSMHRQCGVNHRSVGSR